MIMMTVEIAGLSDVLTLLSSMYLCKPTNESVKRWKGLFAEDSSIFLDGLKSAVSEIDLGSDEELDNLLWEYTRLFVGPYKLPCPPWESVYTSPKRLLQQDAAAQVERIYKEAGLTVNTPDVLPDHIGTELNFLAVLLQEAHFGQTDCIDMTGRFLNEHLLRWVPEFTRDMENAADSLFYKSLARATRNIIEVIGG